MLTPVKKICHSVIGAAEATDFSSTFLYEEMKNKRLPYFKRGGRKFILDDDLRAYVELLIKESDEDA